MYCVLIGQASTPIIKPKAEFCWKGTHVRISHTLISTPDHLSTIYTRPPLRRYYGKLTVGKPSIPYVYRCYFGYVYVIFPVRTPRAGARKLKYLLQHDQMGRFAQEGMGRVQWLGGFFLATLPPKPPQPRKIRIRKGLPSNLPGPVKKLLTLALLHDFVHTSRHPSKLMQEVQIYDENLRQLVKTHHEPTENPILRALQQYDRMAARLTRNHWSPTTSRYSWRATAKINVQPLVQQIEKHQNNVLTLYRIIYDSKELDLLNECLEYGHSSLRHHLLVIANLIVTDWLKGHLSPAGLTVQLRKPDGEMTRPGCG